MIEMNNKQTSPTPEKYWRRVKRVKVKPNDEIERRKERVAELQLRLKYLQKTYERLVDEFKTTCVMVDGLLVSRRRWLSTTKEIPESVANELKVMQAKKVETRRELILLQDTRTDCCIEINTLSAECRQIRASERMGDGK